MKESVWLFLWFLDKMTSVSEEGVGKVLGGKAIQYEDVNKDLDLPIRTYRRYLERLKKYGYINVKRTPYGLIVSVNKAQKVFSQKKKRSAKNGTSEAIEANRIEKRDVPKMAHPADKNGTSADKNGTSLLYDKTIRQDSKLIHTDVATDVADGKRFNDLLFKFKPINPMYAKLFANKTQRKALKELVDLYGFEKMEGLLDVLPEIMKRSYSPRITTPVELQNKMGQLQLFMQQEKGKRGGIADGRAII